MYYVCYANAFFPAPNGTQTSIISRYSTIYFEYPSFQMSKTPPRDMTAIDALVAELIGYDLEPVTGKFSFHNRRQIQINIPDGEQMEC